MIYTGMIKTTCMIGTNFCQTCGSVLSTSVGAFATVLTRSARVISAGLLDGYRYPLGSGEMGSWCIERSGPSVQMTLVSTTVAKADYQSQFKRLFKMPRQKIPSRIAMNMFAYSGARWV